jgi:hypothetical protein
MEVVLNYYDKKAKDREDWGRRELIKSVLDLLSVPDNDQGRPDLDKVAEAWLDLTRDVWYEKLLSRKNRNKILRLKDIRKDLEQKPIDNERLHNAFSSIKIAQSIHTRVVAIIVGVPGN